MSEHENELKKALAENGNFDAEKAGRLAAEAVSRFNFRLRWTERRGMIGLLFCMAVFEFAGIKFSLASTTKAMIGYAVAMLLSYGIGITAVFVSRIMSMLLRVLKEIKQSQLESLGYPAHREVSASDDVRPFIGRSRALGWWEITGWLLALLIVAVTVTFATDGVSAPVWPSGMASLEGPPVTIEAPNIGAPIWYKLRIRMDQGQCKVSRITPERKQAEPFWTGKEFWGDFTLRPGTSLRLDPQGNKGEYWVRFE